MLALVARPAAAGADGVSWTVKPAANNFGPDRQNYGYTINPGGRLEDGIVVVNHATTPLRLALYAADGFTTRAGRLDVVTTEAKPTGVGAWVHPDRDDVTIAPGESVEVPFAITLPNDAAPGTSVHAWTVPWSLLPAIVVLCGLVVAGLAFRPRRARTELHVNPDRLPLR